MRVMIAICVLAVLPNIAFSADCTKADQLWKQSLNANINDKQKLLERAIGLCPTHAKALNNLAVVCEYSGQLKKARLLYQRSLDADSNFIAPLAGLGDIAYTMGRFQEAEKYYDRFLSALQREKAKGDPMNLSGRESEYRFKLDRSRLKWGIHKDSMTKVVAFHRLVDGLSSDQAVRAAGGRVVPERLPLSIRFDYDSAEIKADGWDQLAQLMKALMMDQLRNTKIIVEGHTDLLGDEEYNKRLSLARAEAVKKFLVEGGVSSHRLVVKGMGEANPLVEDHLDKNGQAPNRRVEFVEIRR